MTKDQLQKELNEKVKPGVKPSDLKKLKRSKSVGDIPGSPAPPPNLLQEQLQEKQNEIERLRKKLENKNNLAETSAELDQSLFARHQNLKDWFSQYSKNKNLDEELSENIEQASEELINQDKVIVDLQSKVQKLEQTKLSLQKDLNLATKLAELRKDYPFPENNETYLKYVLYSLGAVLFTLWMITNLRKQNKYE